MNMYTKIYNEIDNYRQDFSDKKRLMAFKSNYNRSYSSMQNYMQGESLEFGLRYDNLATQKSYPNENYKKYQWFPHDIIFPFAKDMLIDLKRFNEKYNSISVTLKNKEKQYELGQVTHIGIWTDYKENNLIRYKLLDLLPFEKVWGNLTYCGSDDWKVYKI